MEQNDYRLMLERLLQEIEEDINDIYPLDDDDYDLGFKNGLIWAKSAIEAAFSD